MARNVEIKARVEKVDLLIDKISAIADKGPIELSQDDVFFNCTEGRFKLRILSENRGELIFYRRADQRGPSESNYFISPTDSPETLYKVLSEACGCVDRVRKKRILYHVGRSRIHLDQVEKLGSFLEIETVLSEGEAAATGIREMHHLLDVLGIQAADLISGAYIDLIARSGIHDA
ncbi:MAG: class IV adenylate cyclase [Desulfuromonadales bacterium]|nr:class IV adenylate cyclase [Desulfuromonadales bacterium]